METHQRQLYCLKAALELIINKILLLFISAKDYLTIKAGTTQWHLPTVSKNVTLNKDLGGLSRNSHNHMRDAKNA